MIFSVHGERGSLRWGLLGDILLKMDGDATFPLIVMGRWKLNAWTKNNLRLL
jgi:hypothetical protein